MKRKLMTILTLAIAAVAARASTLYVAPGGDGDGSDWDHAADLATAAANADATELKLLAGDYPLTAQLSFASGRNVRIVGGYTGDGETRGSEKSTLYRDPSVAQMRLIEATSATLDLQGLAFTNGLFVAVNYSTVCGVALKLTSSTVSMNDCAIMDNGSNPASGDGAMGPGIFHGCVYVSGGTFAATNTVFANNFIATYYYSSCVYGVGLSAASAATITLEGCTFYRNRSRVMYLPNQGQGLRIDGCNLTMKNCLVEENFCRRQENYLHNDAHGGGLFYSGGNGRTCLVEDTIFKGNWLNDGSQSDGAVYVYAEGTCQPTFTRCVFTGNGKRNEDDPAAATAVTSDSGQVRIYSTGTPALLTNCAFVDTANGQGLIVQGKGATVSRCTFANAGTYGIAVWGGTLNLSDSIVWGNASGAISQSGGTTLTTSYCDLQGTALSPSDISVDPLLSTDGFAHLTSAAGYYVGGGFTNGAWTISSGTSPAIDQGDPSLSVDDETQPNGHRANIGAYAGTEVASRSKLGSDPIVHENELKVFAYDVTPLLASGTIRGTVASTGGGANPTVYAVWDTTDHGASSALGDWTHSVEIGTPERWELFSTLMSPVSGLTYCRLLATNEKGTALSDPAIAFTPAEKPTLADVSVNRTSRKFVTAQGTLQADGGAAASLRCRCWATATPETVTTNWYNEGYSVPVGTVASITLSGLTAGTDYQVSFEAVSDVGVTESILAVTTLNETDPIVRYVTPEGAGAKNGLSWANAYDHMQDALDECYVAGDVIYVKEGEYEHYGYADGLNPSAMAIASAAGLSIRGGYAGEGAPGEKGTARTVFKQPNEETWTLGPRRHVRILSSTVSFDGIDFERGSLPASSTSGEDRYGQSVSAKSSYLAFTDCNFHSNGWQPLSNGSSVDHFGGAIALRTGTLAVTNCAFRGNKIDTCSANGNAYGGAIYANNVKTTVSGSTFATNCVRITHFYSEGGAIFADGGGSLAIDHTLFETNWNFSCENYGNNRMRGGTITVSGLSRFDMSDCTVLGGWVNGFGTVVSGAVCAGGAMRLVGTPSTITRTVFRDMGYRAGQHSRDSGAVTLESGSLTLKNVLFSHTRGHALDSSGGSLTADSCTFVGATGYGYYQHGASSVTFTHCIFKDNAAGDYCFYNGADPAFTYCYTQTEKTGDGNSTDDPLLEDAVWCHPRSAAGTYVGGWFDGGEWVTTNTVTSPTIDAGNALRAAEGETEAKPNGHLYNIGYDAGTSAASKSVLGDNPVVDPNVLNVFAYSATGVSKTSATMRGEVASVANKGKVTVTVYWGATDCGKTTEGWDGSATVGSYDAWEQFAYTLSGKIEGTYYYRFRIANDAGEAWTGPSQSFESVDPPTATLDGITHVTRHTAKVSGTLVSDGKAPTTAKVVITLGSEETEYPINEGLSIASGTSFSVDVSDLVTNTTYGVRLEMKNSAGTVTLTDDFTTLSTNAIVRYVSPDGAGIEDGLAWASAYSKLQEAITACCYPGDVICLKEGEYTDLGYSNADDPSLGCVDTLTNLTFRGGYAGEGAPGEKGTGLSVLRRASGVKRLFRVTASTVCFEDIAFEAGRLSAANGYGHGVNATGSSALSFVRCVFRNNGTLADYGNSHFGGGLAASGGSAAFTNCTFSGNWIQDNVGGSGGGAIYARNVALDFAACLFATNRVHVQHWFTPGGAIYAEGGSLKATDCVFNGNYIQHNLGYDAGGGRGALGGALYLNAVPSATFTGCVFDGNYANDARYESYCSKTIVDRSGGTIYATGAKGVTTLSHCLVRRGGMAPRSYNTNWDSGAVTLMSGTMSIDNTLFDGGRSNSVEIAGGTLSMTNVTIAGNNANGLAVWGGAATVKNSIIWGNTNGVMGTCSATYSDIQGVTPDAETHLLCVDPKFRGEVKGKGQQWNVSSSAAATIGAATFLSLQSEAYNLRSSSPCVNAGDATDLAADATDLSGGPRVRSGGLDLGCYEALCRGLLLLVK